VRKLSEGSFKEVVWAALLLSFQTDLEKEVPQFVDGILGTHLSGQHNAAVTVLFLLLLFYGVDFVYQRITKTVEGSHIRAELDKAVTEVAREFRVSEDHVKGILSTRYSKSPRIKLLARAAVRVFHPSKQQYNAGMLINGTHRIEPRLIAEVPSDAQLLDTDDEDTSAPLENVRIELHAQDMDRAKTGWAAVVPELSPNRLKMTLFPPLKPEDIYTQKEVTGDIVLVSRRGKNGKMEPHTFHLVRLR
jgi:hypothetical protein